MAKKKINTRYIDANLVKDALLGWETEPTDEEIEYAIDNIPTADVVEVVRCKDCKYYNNRYAVCEHEHWQDAEGWDEDVLPTDFCSYGERRTDNAG